jgi:hypothetical protein
VPGLSAMTETFATALDAVELKAVGASAASAATADQPPAASAAG